MKIGDKIKHVDHDDISINNEVYQVHEDFSLWLQKLNHQPIRPMN